MSGTLLQHVFFVSCPRLDANDGIISNNVQHVEWLYECCMIQWRWDCSMTVEQEPHNGGCVVNKRSNHVQAV